MARGRQPARVLQLTAYSSLPTFTTIYCFNGRRRLPFNGRQLLQGAVYFCCFVEFCHRCYRQMLTFA